MDGIGALIISPTRELALQIFDELRKIGKHHSISAGLLIGGKSAEEEAKFVTGTFLFFLFLVFFSFCNLLALEKAH